MNKGDFDNVVKAAGRRVSCTRGANTVQVTMASAVGAGEDPLLQDATQDDILVTFLQSDFAGTILGKPNRYDRIADIDARTYAIRLVRDMRGLAGELWGYRALIRGNE